MCRSVNEAREAHRLSQGFHTAIICEEERVDGAKRSLIPERQVRALAMHPLLQLRVSCPICRGQGLTQHVKMGRPIPLGASFALNQPHARDGQKARHTSVQPVCIVRVE